MQTFIEQIKTELQKQIDIIKRDILGLNKNQEHTIYGTIVQYVIQEGLHGVRVSPDEKPNFIAPGQIYTIGATNTQTTMGAIIRLVESPEEISKRYGPAPRLTGLRVEVKYTGDTPWNGIARIVNDFGTEDPKIFTKPDKKCTIRTAVSAKL